MADPVSLGLLAVSTAATVGGTAVSMAGASASGDAAYRQAQYQAGVASVNKDIALQNADYERYVGEAEAQRVGLAGRYRQGQIRAVQGASNLDVNFGSNKQVQESQQNINTYDQSTVRANAARRAYGHEVEAASATASGELYRAAGDNARTAAGYAATTSLLSGASQVSGRWLQASQAGMFGGSTSGPHSLGGRSAEGALSLGY